MIADYLKGTSPEFVRLFARDRNGRKLLSNREIAKASGLGRCTVALLSKTKSWEGVLVGTADKFLRGCNYDPSNTANHRRLLRERKRVYLRRAKPSQLRMIARILGSFGATAANAGQQAIQRS